MATICDSPGGRGAGDWTSLRESSQSLAPIIQHSIHEATSARFRNQLVRLAWNGRDLFSSLSSLCRTFNSIRDPETLRPYVIPALLSIDESMSAIAQRSMLSIHLL